MDSQLLAMGNVVSVHRRMAVSFKWTRRNRIDIIILLIVKLQYINELSGRALNEHVKWSHLSVVSDLVASQTR
jgi:hypothetical protein